MHLDEPQHVLIDSVRAPVMQTEFCTARTAVELQSADIEIDCASQTMPIEVQILSGKALDLIPQLSGPIDLVFIDADKPEYLAYVDALWPKLKPDALMIADNVDSHPDLLGDYVRRMQSRSDTESVTLHIDSGLEFTLCRPIPKA